MINRRASVPLYLQVADDLRVRIKSGEFPPDSQLQGEDDLAYEYGVGKDTIRRALLDLVAENLVVTQRGYRSRVCNPPPLEPVDVAAGMSVVSRPATAVERAERDWPRGTWVLHVFGEDGVGDIWRADRFYARVT